MSRETRVPYNPPFAFHPGVFLAEKLEEMKMSNKEFALRTNKPEKTITAIIKGDSSITPDMAVVFETALGIPAHMWMRKQQRYDEFKARERKEEILKKSIPWMKRFPVAEMINKGWLPEAKTLEEKTRILLNYFGFSSHESWSRYYLDQELKVAFRISLAHSREPEAISAWLRKGELDARALRASEFSPIKLKKILPDLKSLMAKHPVDFHINLQEFLLSVGVRLVFTPCIKKAPINGVTRWLDNETPLIQISGRHKRNDIFWFTLFHEIGHILLHGKKDIFIDSDDSTHKSEAELEANDFAVHWTFPKSQEEIVSRDLPITIEKIKSYSVKFGTHPGLILGRLQYNRLIPHSFGNELFVPVKLFSE